MKKKCLALFSGGLDSVLAVKIIQAQKIEVIGINFISPFFSSKIARRAAREINLKLEIVDISDDIIKLIKNPRYGYGKNINPCIDCHILMLKTAREYLEEIGASFIITGDVLGERPKSQNRRALKIIEFESGNAGFLLRPLSAKLLDPTVPERESIVARAKLLDISGRSRKIQLALAKEYRLKHYAPPAGGCLLTDPAFAARLSDVFTHGEDNLNNIILLKVGRHFRTSRNGKVVVGRDKSENESLLELAEEEDLIFEVKDCPSPIAILRGDKTPVSIEEAAKLTARYSDNTKEKTKVSYGTIKEGFNQALWVERR
ncbi:MAG: tRNA 4-thiouridine(8) synthase ThiI [Candidatus Ratteibacteria bacterium]|nr:tRNA 4-thiouridine(8) synthase ThiI [Candidatus Ratteibacteria bacterium]